jgi:hypothetical protein
MLSYGKGLRLGTRRDRSNSKHSSTMASSIASEIQLSTQDTISCRYVEKFTVRVFQNHILAYHRQKSVMITSIVQQVLSSNRRTPGHSQNLGVMSREISPSDGGDMHTWYASTSLYNRVYPHLSNLSFWTSRHIRNSLAPYRAYCWDCRKVIAICRYSVARTSHRDI